MSSVSFDGISSNSTLLYKSFANVAKEQFLNNQFSEARESAQTALKSDALFDHERVRLINLTSQCFFFEGDYESSLHMANSLLDFSETVPDAHGLYLLCKALIYNRMHKSSLLLTQEYDVENLRRCSPVTRSKLHLQKAVAFANNQQEHEAFFTLAQAFQASEVKNDPELHAYSKMIRAHFVLIDQKFEEARGLLEQGLAILDGPKTEHLQIDLYLMHSKVNVFVNGSSGAFSLLQHALSLCKSNQDKSKVLYALGFQSYHAQLHSQALGFVFEALDLPQVSLIQRYVLFNAAYVFSFDHLTYEEVEALLIRAIQELEGEAPSEKVLDFRRNLYFWYFRHQKEEEAQGVAQEVLLDLPLVHPTRTLWEKRAGIVADPVQE